MDYALQKLLRDYRASGDAALAHQIANYTLRSEGGGSVRSYLDVCNYGPFLNRVIDTFGAIDLRCSRMNELASDDIEFNFKTEISDWCVAQVALEQSAWTLWPVDNPRTNNNALLYFTLQDDLHNLTYQVHASDENISLNLGDDYIDEYLRDLGFQLWAEDVPHEPHQQMGERTIPPDNPELAWNNFIWWLERLNLVERV